jgi:hypothetical protein
MKYALPILPQLAADQAQKHGRAGRSREAPIKDCKLNQRVEGARYIVAASPSDAWATHVDHVAVWLDGAWRFFTPGTGWLAWVVDEAALLA